MAVSQGRSGKLTAGGILCIASGVIGLSYVIIILVAGTGGTDSETNSTPSGALWTYIILTSIIPSAIGILSGYFALRRKHFWLAIIGAIAALLFAPTLGYQGIPLGMVLPMAAVILIWMSKKEFR